jgi:hypothetical protein
VARDYIGDFVGDNDASQEARWGKLGNREDGNGEDTVSSRLSE